MNISFDQLGPRAKEQVLAKIAIEEVQRQKKSSKYGAKKMQACLADGTQHTFDSVKEFDRYQELVLMERAGQISDLRLQVPFELIPKQKLTSGKTERACSYVADFVYEKNGEKVVEDVKGYRDPASAAYAKFTIKRKLMLFIHHIEVQEV